MIGLIEGVVAGIVRDTVVIKTNGLPGQGIGYRVHVPASVLARVKEGDTLVLWTHLAVRENAEDLYGFETKDELKWFELLLTVPGVGPKSALAIMNAVDIPTLESAIAAQDPAILDRAYGVGRKTAEKVVLELKDKVAVREGKAAPGSDAEVVEALVALGYSTKEARDAARALPKDLATTEEKVREALRYASRN